MMLPPLAALRTSRDPAAPLARRIFDVLHHRILTFDLKPGQQLNELALCREFDVSRAPVREALQRLAERRLVDIRPQRGTLVAPIRIEDLERAQFMREAVEVALAKRAVERPDRLALCTSLRNEIRVQSVFREVGERERFYASDERFHRLIAEFVNLGHVQAEMERIKMPMDRFRMLVIGGIEDIPTVIRQHEDIVDALERGDAALAEARILRHLRRVFDYLPTIVERFPEYFETSTGGLRQYEG